MGYSESGDGIAARVKEQADIVQVIGECVELKKAGVRYLGLCPFHGEKTPSFSVHPGQQFFHCFGCGASGDVYSFLMKYHNLDFPEALKNLAGRYQIELPERRQSAQEQERDRLRKRMFGVNEKVAAIFREYLIKSPKAAVARRYLEKRQIPPETQEQFKLGYAPSPDAAGWDFLGSQLNHEESQIAEQLGLLVKKETGGTYDRFRDRVLFPLFDRQGRTIGFGGRILGDGQPKYMNSPESPVFNKSRSLLGLYQQGDAIRRRQQAVLVEGNFDLVSLVVHGCPNVVAPLGTALTVQQLQLLKRYADECVLLFDGDAAGVKAAVRSVPLFLSEQMAGKVALLPKGHDPDTYIQEEGLAALEELLTKALPLPEFVLAQLVEEHGLTLDGKSRIIKELRPLLQAAASPLQRSLMLSHFSETIGLPVEELGAAITIPDSAPPLPPEPERQQTAARPSLVPLKPSQKRLLTFMILYPASFQKLEEAGIRSCLRGTVGEILFLQLMDLLSRNSEVEPEELLEGLPEGGERKIVADILLESSSGNDELGCQGTDEELSELLLWLQKEELGEQSNKLMEQITECSEQNNVAALQEYLRQKMEVDKKLQSLRPRILE